jgi:5'-nucleotidase / UDP-sugar diphosphatase
MGVRFGLSSVSKRVRLIMPAILVIASFLAIPADSGGARGDTGELYFSILHTNDMHSELIPHSPAVDYGTGGENSATGGFARLATAVDEIREKKADEGEPVLVFDAGDFLGSGPFAWLALNGSAPELTIMQEMGYDAATIGNHEYDYGPDVLAQYLTKAGYPQAHQETLVLASNTKAPEDHPLAALGLYRDTGMFELENGLKVGVFGIVGEDAILSMGDIGDMQFLDQQETARAMVEELQAQGADVIVCLSHSGVDDDRVLAREVPGINVVVGGHSHTALFEPVMQGSTIIVQAGALGEYLGQLELAYNPDTGKVRVCNGEDSQPFLIPIDSSFAPDPQIEVMVREYTAKLNAYVGSVTDGEFDDVMSTVARSDFVLSNLPSFSETALGDFVTDAMRFAGEEFTGERVDLGSEASGNIRNSIFPGTTEESAGNVSLYEIIEAVGVGRGLDGYPGCPIASVYLTGQEVCRVLEIGVLLQRFMGDSYFLQFSGLKYSYNPANAVLLTVPFINLPIPTTRAVTNAELYTWDGVESIDGEEYARLDRGDQRLYHVVTNAYLLLFLPLAADMLPQLAVAPKNADGEPVPMDSLDELIIRHPDGTELKVWEAVLLYAQAQPAGEDGVPEVAEYYDGVAGRITKVWTFPFIGWLLVILGVIIGGLIYLLIRRRKRRISREAVFHNARG